MAFETEEASTLSLIANLHTQAVMGSNYKERAEQLERQNEVLLSANRQLTESLEVAQLKLGERVEAPDYEERDPSECTLETCGVRHTCTESPE